MKPKKREKIVIAIKKYCSTAGCAEGYCKLYKTCSKFKSFETATDKQIKKVYEKLKETKHEQ